LTFIIDPSSVSNDAILADLEVFLDAAPDSAKWKDFFQSSSGTLVKQLMAGLGTFLSYNTIVARRESFISHALNRSSVVAAGETLGYSAFRGRNAILELDIVPNVTTVWPKWTVIGSVKDKDLILTTQTVVNAGVPITVQVIVGEVKTDQLVAANQNPASFRFKEALISQDVRVYLNNVEMSTSELLLNLINEKFIIQTNVYDSVNILYLNLDTFVTRYNTGGVIRIDWIERSNLSFVVANVSFDFGVLTEARIAAVFQDVEAIETIRVNAPLFNETQFTIRGRDDYLKTFKLSDPTITSASGEDVSPAIVRLYYVRIAQRLFTALEKSTLITKLSSYRPFGMRPPLISDPTIVFLNINITATLTGTGNIVNDVHTIVQKNAHVLTQLLDFEAVEQSIEELSYVKIARIEYDPVVWSANTIFRRGTRVLPTAPTLFQDPFVYEAGGKIYKSGPTEPKWPDAEGDTVTDESLVLSAGVKASSTHNGDVFCATNPGLSGNFITLVFDGFDTNKEVIDVWNEANPFNPVKLCSGNSGNVNPAGTLVIGRNAGDIETGLLPAGGTIGSDATNGNEPSGADAGVNRIGTGLSWTTMNLSGTPPVWLPNFKYPLETCVKPSPAAIIANPALAAFMFCVDGFINRANEDTTSSTAKVVSVGTTYIAKNPGYIGNGISLVFDGIKTISVVVSDWNTANPTNKVCFFPTANGSNVHLAATIVLVGGGGTQATVDDSGTTFISSEIGLDGNLVTLTPNGITSVQSIVDSWNLSHPDKPIFFIPLSNAGNIIPAGTLIMIGGQSKINKEPGWPIGPVVC
jgi:hypothetical protein